VSVVLGMLPKQPEAICVSTTPPLRPVRWQALCATSLPELYACSRPLAITIQQEPTGQVGSLPNVTWDTYDPADVAFRVTAWLTSHIAIPPFRT